MILYGFKYKKTTDPIYKSRIGKLYGIGDLGKTYIPTLFKTREEARSMNWNKKLFMIVTVQVHERSY